MSKHAPFGSLVVLAVLCACSQDSRVGASTAAVTTGVYTGTIYAAGAGGHAAVVSVSIDPTNATSPIDVTRLDKIPLGDSAHYNFHDVRIDRARGRAGKMFWSTIKADENGQYRYGRVDLYERNVDCDAAISMPPDVAAPGFCGSGQSADKFLPVWMGTRGFVDVINKDTCVHENRIYLDTIPGFPTNWNMAHGSNSKDFSVMTFAINLVDPITHAALNQGQLVSVDMASLLAGAPVITAVSAPVQGPPKTTFFRQEWSQDRGTFIQGGKAAFYRFDGNLAEQCRYLLPTENGHQGENHDAVLIPGTDYAVMQMRRWVDYGFSLPVLDGQLQVIKLSTCQPVGSPVSMCVACHARNGVLKDEPGIDGKYVSCGLDSTW